MTDSLLPLPDHIGVIPDGNRRYAKAHQMSTGQGHQEGAKRIEELIGWVQEIGVKETTIYVLSEQNLNRPQHEVAYLMRLMDTYFNQLSEDPRIHREEMNIRFVGNHKHFSRSLQQTMDELQTSTEQYTNYRINFATGYSGRNELVQCVQELLQKTKEGNQDPDEITEDDITAHLQVQSSPDLIIRTGGEHRTSNFLIWQSHYSEWFFIDDYWPSFSKERLESIITEYRTRNRRYGK